MARKFKLRPIDSQSESSHEKSGAIDRREFMRLSFNTAAGLITTASLGSVGFASFLMGQAGGGSADSSIKFYVPKGSDVWYGNMDKQPMTMQAFIDESANSTTGMVGAAGLWSGLPIIATYVPHEENKNRPLEADTPRFQFMDGYTSGGAYVGSVSRSRKRKSMHH